MDRKNLYCSNTERCCVEYDNIIELYQPDTHQHVIDNSIIEKFRVKRNFWQSMCNGQRVEVTVL